MIKFTYHTIDTAPDDSKETLASLKSAMGFIPNIFSVVANSGSALSGLVHLTTEFSHSSFTPQEQQVILMATSTENECVYCVAGHSAFAKTLNISAEDISALRHKENTSSPRYNVLANTVRQLVISKGRLSEDALVSFIAGGYNQAQFLELVMGICVKTFTNYVSNALSVELDDAFKPYAWQRPSEKHQNVA